MTLNEMQKLVDEYLEVFPDEAKRLARLQQRLEIDEVFNNRNSFQGHGTGAAIVLSPDKTKMLLIYHKLFKGWYQPGGHWDPGDPSPWIVAQREAEEETSVEIAHLIPVVKDKPHIPLDIDSHDVPARPSKNEPPHIHHDIRYVFLAKSEAVKPQESEVDSVQWVPIADPNDPRLANVRSIVQKLHAVNMV